MSYAIMRMEKLKGDLRGIGKHIDRSSRGENISPQNADSEQINSNIHWDNNGKSYTQKEWAEFTKSYNLNKRVNENIKKSYTQDKAIRKDAVRAIEYIFTSDNFKMNEIFSDEKLYKNWIKDNKDFVTGIYGEKNIVSMHLHCDEKTYHMEIVVTPITEDGRISAKEFINGRKDLIEQQSNYAELMSKYGMKRGEKGSTAKHERPNTIKKTKNYDRNR